MRKLFLLFLTLSVVSVLSACTKTRNGLDNNNDNSQNSTSSYSESSAISTPDYVAPSDNNQSDVTANTAITREKALEIALNHATVKQEDIRDLEIELDKENGITVWEVDFEAGNMDYSYDINAETGAITERDRDIEF